MKKTMSVMGTWLMAGMIGYGTFYLMSNKKKMLPMVKEINDN